MFLLCTIWTEMPLRRLLLAACEASCSHDAAAWLPYALNQTLHHLNHFLPQIMHRHWSAAGRCWDFSCMSRRIWLYKDEWNAQDHRWGWGNGLERWECGLLVVNKNTQSESIGIHHLFSCTCVLKSLNRACTYLWPSQEWLRKICQKSFVRQRLNMRGDNPGKEHFPVSKIHTDT